MNPMETISDPKAPSLAHFPQQLSMQLPPGVHLQRLLSKCVGHVEGIVVKKQKCTERKPLHWYDSDLIDVEGLLKHHSQSWERGLKERSKLVWWWSNGCWMARWTPWKPLQTQRPLALPTFTSNCQCSCRQKCTCSACFLRVRKVLGECHVFDKLGASKYQKCLSTNYFSFGETFWVLRRQNTPHQTGPTLSLPPSDVCPGK